MVPSGVATVSTVPGRAPSGIVTVIHLEAATEATLVLRSTESAPLSLFRGFMESPNLVTCTTDVAMGDTYVFP